MRIRNVDLHVEISGHGPAMIWGHGMTSSIAAEDVLDWFQWKNISCKMTLIRYDARGHGKSAGSYRPEDFQWDSLAQDMLDLADACVPTQEAARFIAGGASMGCASALCAALKAPERIKALVLVIPPTLWETRAAQAQLYRRAALLGSLMGGRLMGTLMMRDMDRMLPSWLVQQEPVKSRGLGIGLAALSRRTLWNLFHGAAKSDLPAPENFAALAGIPTLICAWHGDPAHPVSSAEALHRLLPESELFIAENYAGFATIAPRISDFVDKHAGS